MDHLSPVDVLCLKNDIACREYSGSTLAKTYGTTVADLRSFVEENREELEQIRKEQEPLDTSEDASTQPTPTELADLWITNKFERLKRLQEVAERMYPSAHLDAVSAREFRSYLMLAANELGQLLHRGSGENSNGAVLSIEVDGINLDDLK